jgi:diguanylate cyclase (GGDEF)-like protein
MPDLVSDALQANTIPTEHSTPGLPRAFADRLRAVLRLRSRARTYPVLGALVAFTIPAGLPVVRALEGGDKLTLAGVADDLIHFPATYAYVTFSSLALMTTLAYMLGRWSERAHHLSVTDSLTGLFNRRHFASRLPTEMRRDRRNGRPTCVMCLDLDHLKAINDGLGHEAGDDALIVVAQVLSNSVRATDVVARFGGDEFAVLLPQTAASEAIVLGERILAEVTQRSTTSTSPLGLSIGIAELSATATPNELLAAADAALYWAKKTGGGRVAVAPASVLRAASGSAAATDTSTSESPAEVSA